MEIMNTIEQVREENSKLQKVWIDRTAYIVLYEAVKGKYLYGVNYLTKENIEAGEYVAQGLTMQVVEPL